MIPDHILMIVGGMVAGLIGSLSGLGGGMVVVPLLVIGFGVDFYHAIGASIMCVIATSSVASCRYAKGGHANIRVALFLATGTVLGALGGANIALYVPKNVLMVLFGVLLIYSVVAPFFHSRIQIPSNTSDPFRLSTPEYQVSHVLLTYLLMVVAGLFSGLLGIGSGAVKVLAMDRLMQLPFRVSTTTSNVMIGITAVASASVFMEKGLIEGELVAPIVLGVTFGALVGTLLFERLKTSILRTVFSSMLLLIAAQMLFEGVWGG